jgi:hypothetical protein
MAIFCKLTKIDDGVVMATPTDRVRVIFDNKNNPDQKCILYIGFYDVETANRCYQYLLDKGIIDRYDFKTDTGMCKPRRSKRVDTCAWEIKIHRPTQFLIDLFIAKSRPQN